MWQVAIDAIMLCICLHRSRSQVKYRPHSDIWEFSLTKCQLDNNANFVFDGTVKSSSPVIKTWVQIAEHMFSDIESIITLIEQRIVIFLCIWILRK